MMMTTTAPMLDQTSADFAPEVKATIKAPTAGYLSEAEATRRVEKIRAHARASRPSTDYRVSPDWQRAVREMGVAA